MSSTEGGHNPIIFQMNYACWIRTSPHLGEYDFAYQIMVNNGPDQ